MTNYMGRDELRGLVKGLAYCSTDKGNLIDLDTINHILGVANKSVEFALEIVQRYPHLITLLNTQKMFVGGAGHDLGKLLQRNRNLHGLRSAKFIAQRALELGLADEAIDVLALSRIARVHGFTLEEVRYAREQAPQELGEFAEDDSLTDAETLIPRTIPEMIVAAADFYVNEKGYLINPIDRIRGIKERYQSGTKYAETGQALVWAVAHGATDRVAKICEQVDDLRNGRLSIARVEELVREEN